MDIDTFKKEVEEFVQEIRDGGAMAIPGDLEVSRIKENEVKGLEVDEKLYETLTKICTDLDIDLDSYLTE